MSKWEPIETCPAGVVVMTKIDDEHGCRNEQPLLMTVRVPGVTAPMFWYPDKSMYVYYRPTHWRR